MPAVFALAEKLFRNFQLARLGACVEEQHKATASSRNFRLVISRNLVMA